MTELTPEARLAMMCISRQFPNAAAVLRLESDALTAENGRLRDALRRIADTTSNPVAAATARVALDEGADA